MYSGSDNPNGKGEKKVAEGYSFKKKNIQELQKRLSDNGVSASIKDGKIVVEYAGAMFFRGEFSKNYGAIYSIHGRKVGGEGTGLEEALVKLLNKEYPNRRRNFS